MADIDIQREHIAWPWVVGLLALAFVIWVIADFVDRSDEPTVATMPTTEEALTPPGEPNPATAEQTAAARFQAWVRDSAAAPQSTAGPHDYTREGVRRLSAALGSLVARDTAPQVHQQLETVRQQIQQIQQSDPSSSQHANQARQAFLATVNVLESLQQRPHLREANLQQHVQAARQSAESVRTDQPLQEQRAAVHQFFEHMAAALETAERHMAT